MVCFKYIIFWLIFHLESYFHGQEKIMQRKGIAAAAFIKTFFCDFSSIVCNLRMTCEMLLGFSATENYLIHGTIALKYSLPAVNLEAPPFYSCIF